MHGTIHRAVHRAVHAIHATHAVHVVKTIHVHLKGRPLVAAVLAVVNLAAGEGGLLLDGANTLQGRVERREVNEGHLLVLDDLDVLDLTKALKLLPEEEVVHVLIDAANKDIASGPVLDGVEDLLGQRLWLSPTDLDLAILDDEAAGVGLTEEELGRSGVDEGDEGAALLRQDLDGVNQAAVHVAEDLIRAGVWVDASKVDRAVARVVKRHEGSGTAEWRAQVHSVLLAGGRLALSKKGGRRSEFACCGCLVGLVWFCLGKGVG